jgi:hypothetical protein
MQQLGSIMFALREQPLSKDELAKAVSMPYKTVEDWLRLLSRIAYIDSTGDRYQPSIPVLTPRDRKLVRQLGSMGHEILTSWLTSNYDSLKNELSTLSPTGHGVPFAESFTTIWHYVFGLANRKLVHAGLFADPYALKRKFKGFIPVLYHDDAL